MGWSENFFLFHPLLVFICFCFVKGFVVISSKRNMPVSDMAWCVLPVTLVGCVLAVWWRLPVMLVVLVGVLVRGLMAKYPVPLRKTDEPDERKVKRFHWCKDYIRGVCAVRSWVGWRVSHVVAVLVGFLVSAGVWWVWLVNMVCAVMVLAGWRYAHDRKKDRRFVCRGVSVRACVKHASKRIRMMGLCVLGACVLVGGYLWYKTDNVTAGIRSVCVLMLLMLLLVWSVERHRQLAGWQRQITVQELIDSWTQKGMPLAKTWVNAFVTQVTVIPDRTGNDGVLVARIRIPEGNMQAVKMGSTSVRALAKSAGYKLAVVLQARAHGVDSDVDSQCIRLVLGDNFDQLPDMSKPQDNRLATLVSDIAYGLSGEIVHKIPPLTKTVNVARDTTGEPAWLVTCSFMSGSGVDMSMVSVDWFGQLIYPSLPVERLMGGLPVVVDSNNEYHVFMRESTVLVDEWDTRVRVGQRSKMLMDKFFALKIPARLGIPIPDYMNTQTWDSSVGDVEFVPLDMQHADVADLVKYDVSHVVENATYCGFACVNNQVGLLSVGGVRVNVRMLNTANVGNAMVLNSVLTMILARLVGQGVSVGLPVYKGKNHSVVWRVPVSLSGVTVKDVMKRNTDIVSLLGLNVLLVEDVSPVSCALWVADGLYVGKSQRDKFSSGQDQFIKLVLQEAWRQVGVADTAGVGMRVNRLQPVSAQGLLKADFTIPDGKTVVNVDNALDKFLVIAGYTYGRVLPRGDEHGANGVDILLCDQNPLPQKIDMPDIITGMTLGVDDMGQPVVWNVKRTPHLAVMGKTGAGKSSASRVLVYQALQAGWQVVICDSNKQASDYAKWAKRLALGWGVTNDMAEAVIGWVHHEMMERSKLNSQYGVSNITDLPEQVRPNRLLVVFDEFNSYLATMDEKTMANPTNDMDIANSNADIKNRVRSVSVTAGRLADIAVQGRALGVHMLLGAQRVGKDEVRKVPNANAFYRSLGKVLLGSDSVLGVVSSSNVKVANRLQKNLLNAGNMPAGRGVFETTEGALIGVQTYWDFDQENLARLTQGMPDVTPVDVSQWLPQSAEHFGLLDDTEIEPITPVMDSAIMSSEVEELDDTLLDWD